ncbi:conserved hypothetical protein, partial [Ricinus communis]
PPTTSATPGAKSPAASLSGEPSGRLPRQPTLTTTGPAPPLTQAQRSWPPLHTP